MSKQIPESTMTEKKIAEGNRLIAEFMGYPTKFPRTKFTDGSDYIKEILPRYDSDWNLLMDAVEKIAKIKLTYSNVNEAYYPYPRTFGMLTEDGDFMVRLNCAPLFTAQTLIEAAWLAVVDYINSHNEQNIKSETDTIK